MQRPKLVGINHVALEVGDIDEALAFYGSIFDLVLRGRSAQMAFIDIGDQFIALSRGRTQGADDHRHFGLVVDDRSATRDAIQAAGVEVLPGRGLDFSDPFGNLVQIVQYDEVQFLKADSVLRALGVEPGKTEQARAELRAKGIDAE